MSINKIANACWDLAQSVDLDLPNIFQVQNWSPKKY